MKRNLKSIIIDAPLKIIARFIFGKPKQIFIDSRSYWEERYARKRSSGAGSYGRLAEFKARVINHIVEQKKIKSVIEFGCGDGNQLTLARYPKYIGYDVSHKAIELCKKLFASDASKQFYHVSEFGSEKAELILSLDVIYHLVENEVYENYMDNLFKSASKYVLIYSSNYDDEIADDASHVKHRCFSDWIEKNAPDFELVEKIRNDFPYDESRPRETSPSDFYLYKKK